MIQHSLHAWADELGMDDPTLKMRLTKAGVEIKTYSKLPASIIFSALLGDRDAEKNRLTAAQAEKVERENAEARGQLHSQAHIERIVWEECLSPLRELLLGFPKITGNKMKSVMQSRSVPAEVSVEIVEIANKAIDDIMAKIRRPSSVPPPRKEK